MFSRFILLIALLVCAPLAPAPAGAQFYRGKQVQILIAGTAGGGIDIGARIIARHLGKYLPGNPAIVPQLMPGAGGIRMLDHMITVAPKDGTVIGITPPGPIIEPLIGKRQASYRMADFVAIGAMTKEVSLCISWGTSKFKTIEDAIRGRMVVAGTGAGASPDIYPVVLNEVLHTNFKVVTGYQGSQETIVAIERGEVDGRCGWGWSSLKSTRPDWIRDKKINFLLQLALAKSPNIPRLAAADGPGEGPGGQADADTAVWPARAQQAVLWPARNGAGANRRVAEGVRGCHGRRRAARRGGEAHGRRA